MLVRFLTVSNKKLLNDSKIKFTGFWIDITFDIINMRKKIMK